MRVLHVLTRAHRRGAETFGVVLHEELLARGDSSQIVALSPAPPHHEALPVPVLGPAPRDPRSLLALRRLAQSAEVVVAHGSATLLACRLALLGSAVPFVYVNIGDPLHWAGSAGRRARVRWMIKAAAGVGAISPTAQQRLVSHLRVDPHKVRFTGNGRRGEDFLPPNSAERRAAREAWTLPADAPVAVTVASLTREKRLDVAIAAIAQLPDWWLLVVGHGPAAAGLRDLAERQARGRVVFTGSLADVRDAYRAADCAVLTSETEGLPGVLIEAALMGLPLVASDVGFVADVVIDHHTGRLLPVGDDTSLAAALRDAYERAAVLGPAARRLALERFELAEVVNRWQTLLADCQTLVDAP